MPALYNSCKLIVAAGQLVDLVDEQDDGGVHLLHFLQELHVLLGVLYHIGYVEKHVGILQGRLGEGKH